MKLVTLVENTACRDGLHSEHGLSLYLETNSSRILFDMGQTDAFARNAEKLGIDLSRVDLAVLSHGHYDHGGGLTAFFRINAKAPVYIHKAAFGQHYNGREKFIGLEASLRNHPRIIFTNGECQLTPGIRLTDCNDQDWHRNSWGLNCREGEEYFPDTFAHEQYLEILEGSKRILISGCSHKGILNIARHFRPDVLIGGFHLNKVEDAAVLQAVGEALLDTGGTYYTGHCTGRTQFDRLKKTMGQHLQYISTGTVIEL